MLVVSDTSPLNYLILIGQDGVLPVLFGQVYTTPGVISELSHKGSPDRVRKWADHLPIWLEIKAPAIIEPSLRLGKGESEAISLARQLHADAVLIDERKGGQEATRLGLLVTGTLGVLELAADKELLSLPETIDALRRTTFRASAKLFEEILDRDRKRTRG